MKLQKLIIKNLFGHFDHEVEFKEENITILTAPNGYGKTVCLKVIDAIYNKKLSFLCDLPFTSIELHTSEGMLSIEKITDAPNNIVLSYSDIDDQHKYYFSKDEITQAIAAFIPFLRKISSDEWEDRRTDEIFTLDEVVENFSDNLTDEVYSNNYPQWFEEFSGALNAHFIQDQRLMQWKISSRKNRKKNFIDTIGKYAEELSKLIRKSELMSSSVSQELDATFLERLLLKDNILNPMDADELKEALKNLQKKRSDLSKFNLLSSAQSLDFDGIQFENIKVLTLYARDTKKKLAAYDDIYPKIELFSRILNSKGMSFKQIKISSKNGFEFEAAQGGNLKLAQLSSGEQHQVVLLYDLIFKMENNALVLIDEPEISLHVAWQKEFLKDLKEIIGIQDIPVVIATHSPQIIDGDWDLTVNLNGHSE